MTVDNDAKRGKIEAQEDDLVAEKAANANPEARNRDLKGHLDVANRQKRNLDRRYQKVITEFHSLAAHKRVRDNAQNAMDAALDNIAKSVLDDGVLASLVPEPDAAGGYGYLWAAYCWLSRFWS